MDKLRGVQVNFEEAKTLADLSSIYLDLKFVNDALIRVRELSEKEHEDDVLLQALWTAALIAYVRCFTSGKRFGLTVDIFKGIEGAQECHEYFKNMRNKHVVHSVNPFEEVGVELQLSPPGSDKREVLAVSVLTKKFMAPVKEGAENFQRLAIVAFKMVANLCREYHAKVLEVGKILPIEELYSNSPARLVAPGPEAAGTARNS